MLDEPSLPTNMEGFEKKKFTGKHVTLFLGV